MQNLYYESMNMFVFTGNYMFIWEGT